VTGEAQDAYRGTGVSPEGTAAGTMSTAPVPEGSPPFPGIEDADEIGWVER
jgi:hypothetical protein